MAKGDIVRWITVKGRRIPIYEGESTGDAVKRMTAKDKRVEKKVDETFKKMPQDISPSRAKEMKASFNRTLANSQEQLAALNKELKKHPDDVHTDYIKKRIMHHKQTIKEYKEKLKKLG